jgi:hypothetical protein
MGGLLLTGGLGLVSTASLVADGTPVSPFESLPGRIWVVRLNDWQSEATAWAFGLLALAMVFWWAEYRWVRRLRRAWLAPAPEV